MEQIKNIAKKIDELSLRERAMVFIGVIALIFTLWDTLLMKPLELDQQKTIADINKKNTERMLLVTQVQNAIKQSKVDPDEENVAKLKKLRSKLIDLQAELESASKNLVSPKDIPKILETVLHKTGGLTLNNLQSLGVTPLVEKEITDVDKLKDKNETVTELTADNIDNAFKHSLKIEFSGEYLTTLNYLKSLEELEWGFFWENFELNVIKYPEAKVSFEIFTLSLKREWIGV